MSVIAGTSTRREHGATAASHLALWGWSLVVVVPLIWTVLSSFKTTSEILDSPLSLPAHWSFDNYINAWAIAGIGGYFLNSVIVVTGGLVLTMTFGSMTAYVIARFEFLGRGLVRALILGGMTFPLFLAVVPLFFILQQLGLLNSLPGLIVVYGVFSYPFTVFFLSSFFADLPREVAEAAAIDGAGEWRTFFQVMLPMSAPGLAAVALLNFVGLWNQYLLPLVLNTDQTKFVLTQGMASFASQAGYSVDFGALFAGAVMTVLPVLVVYVIFQRRLQESVTQGSIK